MRMSEPPTDDIPPLLGSWTKVYALVLGELLLLILLFRLFSWSFA